MDSITFIGFIICVVSVSIYASRKKEQNSSDYFLAGRKLSWWPIGLSLIAANISSEHFIGMSGQGYSLGMAIASFEWMAAVALVFVAIFFLPRFIELKVFTMPQYLEYRYDKSVRLLVALMMLFFYVFVTLAVVLYSGALALKLIFDVDIIIGIWIIGIISGFYTIYGGLKAVIWADVIQALTLLGGGVLVLILTFLKIDHFPTFWVHCADKLHVILPWNHPQIPWTAVIIGGLWIPQFFYFGVNQFITQRTLAAKSLKDGQMGILLAAFIKLLIPFIVVLPGIMAYYLYHQEIKSADSVYPFLLKKVLPPGLLGLMLAALFGAVMSTLDSLLNSAATIFTIDIYKGHLSREASQKRLIFIGRVTTMILTVLGCLWAPLVSKFDRGIYMFIQEFWGFIQPGILAAFLFGFFWRRVTARGAQIGILLNIPLYGLLRAFWPISFLHHMFITFAVISLVIVTFTLLTTDKSKQEEFKTGLKLGAFPTLTPPLKMACSGVIFCTLLLYVIFF